MRKFQALGSALALTLAATVIAVPAMARTHHPSMARTHHPSTASERAQTRDLNQQQLAIAQAPANQQAMNGNAPESQNQNQNQNQNVPADQMSNGGQTAQAPGATQNAQPSSGQQAPTSSKAPSGN